ncbi:hypothetical protein U1Q18_037335 [Sarracenia purpurea var. burkii]
MLVLIDDEFGSVFWCLVADEISIILQLPRAIPLPQKHSGCSVLIFWATIPGLLGNTKFQRGRCPMVIHGGGSNSGFGAGLGFVRFQISKILDAGVLSCWVPPFGSCWCWFAGLVRK